MCEKLALDCNVTLHLQGKEDRDKDRERDEEEVSEDRKRLLKLAAVHRRRRPQRFYDSRKILMIASLTHSHTVTYVQVFKSHAA